MSLPQIAITISNLINEVRALEAERPRVVVPFVTEVYKEIVVEASHLLPNHKAKCQFLHGHSYRVGVTLRSKLNDKIGAEDEGMAIDFKAIKEQLKINVDAPFDHNYINDVLFFNVADNESNDMSTKPLYLRTTAEQMAWWIYVQMFFAFEAEIIPRPPRMVKKVIEVVSVDVWETTTSRATAKREYFNRHILENLLNPEDDDNCEEDSDE